MRQPRYLFCLFAISALLTLAGIGCNLTTRRNFRQPQNPAGSLFLTSSFLMERTSSPTDAIIRFKTTKPVLCEMTYWKQSLGEQTPTNEAKIKACSNTSPSSDFSETLTGLAVNEAYFVKIAAWEAGSDRNKAVSVVIREQFSSSTSTDAYFARVNVPLKTLDIHRVRPTKALNELIATEQNRERKCQKSISAKTPSPIIGPSSGVLLESVAAKGLVEGAVEKNAAAPDRISLSKPSSNFSKSLELTYRANGKPGSVAIDSFATLVAVKAISDRSANFPEPQLTVAEREIVALNKDRNLRIEWSLNGLENASSVALQLGYPGQTSSVFCVFEAKAGFGEVPAELLRDIPSGKHDMSLSLFSYVTRPADDKTIFAWAAAFVDWRVAKFQVL